MYQDIINTEELLEIYRDKNSLLVDCRYDLADSSAGKRDYLESHIAGAVFADIHDHLSGPPVSENGRHPLPTAERLVEVFRELGISGHTQVIAYDGSSGAFAARLWWLLRYMGHRAVAVLDGGWQAWRQADGMLESGDVRSTRGSFEGQARRDRLVLIDEIGDAALLVDSREAPRYRGELEPIDPYAGHIPGALNRCWKDNITENGYFASTEVLKADFAQLFGDVEAENVVFYCGSGVSACHNLLAASRAGLVDSKLYAGSWSEWCRDPARPRATLSADEE